MNRLPVAIAEDLYFDMARRLDVFLEQHPRVAEGRFRLAGGGGEGVVEFGMLVDPAHATAAAPGHRLDQDGIADLVGLALEQGWRLLVAVIARHHRHAGLLHQRLGAVLEAHGADRGGRRPDEGDVGAQRRLGEVGIFGKKAVARMNALRPGAACHLDQLVDVEIALARRRRADRIGLVAGAHMQRARVGFRIDRDRPQAQASRGARNAHRDLAAVSDQDRGKHEPGISPKS